MGRHNHENAVAIPGYKVSVILSGDDTFSAPASQMYMYLTKGANGLMNDAGALYGFKSDDAGRERLRRPLADEEHDWHVRPRPGRDRAR